MTIYLDNSATTRQHNQVTETMIQVMKKEYGNPSSLHRMGLAAEKLVKKGRGQVAQAIGAMAEEIIFTGGGTESDNMAIRGIAHKRHRKGRHLITTTIEHPAVVETFCNLEKEGFDVSYIPVDQEGFVDLQQLAQAITEETMLISVMNVNNEVGTIQPLEKIAALKGKQGDTIKNDFVFHSDCVQSLGKLHIPTGCLDLASFSGHKIHGPKGVGALYKKKSVGLVPEQTGGGQENAFRPGTENVPGIVGFGLAAEMAEKSLQQRTDTIRAMRDALRQGIIDEIPDVKINTPEHDTVCCLLNVSFLGTRGEVLLHTLEQSGIFVSTGSACSSKKPGSHVLSAMGCSAKEVEGAIRFSLSMYNTMEEMEEVIDKTKKAVATFRRLGTFR